MIVFLARMEEAAERFTIRMLTAALAPKNTLARTVTCVSDGVFLFTKKLFYKNVDAVMKAINLRTC